MFPLFSILRREPDFSKPPATFVLLHLKRVHLMEWVRAVVGTTLSLEPHTPLPPLLLQSETDSVWKQIREQPRLPLQPLVARACAVGCVPACLLWSHGKERATVGMGAVSSRQQALPSMFDVLPCFAGFGSPCKGMGHLLYKMEPADSLGPSSGSGIACALVTSSCNVALSTVSGEQIWLVD